MIFYRYREMWPNSEECFVHKELQENSLKCNQMSKLNDAYEGVIPMKYYDKEHKKNFEEYRGELKDLLERSIKFMDEFDLCSGVSPKQLMDSLDEIKTIGQVDFIYKLIYRNVVDKVLESRDLARVCCFSTDNESELMWSHYADGMKGICVGYDFDDEVILSPVAYDDELKYFDIDEVVSIMTNPNVHEDSFFHDVYRVRISKSKNWSYEKSID